jgi:hypothetical protein
MEDVLQRGDRVLHNGALREDTTSTRRRALGVFLSSFEVAGLICSCRFFLDDGRLFVTGVRHKSHGKKEGHAQDVFSFRHNSAAELRPVG